MDDFAVGVVGQERRAAGQTEQVLGEHVEAAGAGRIAVQFAGGDAEDGGLAFQDLEAVGGDEDGFGRLVHAVVGAADTLQQAGDALRGADLDDLVDAAPVDAEVQGGGRHHRPQAAGGHGGFDFPPLLDFERAVVEGDRQRRVVQFPQRLEHQFGLGAGVDEDDGHAGAFDVRHDLGGGFQAHVAGPGQAALRAGSC